MTGWLRWADRAYGVLLYAYPKDFRRRYGLEMRQVFRDRAKAAMRERNLCQWILRVLVDSGMTAVQERVAAVSFGFAVTLIASLLASWLTAYVDVHNDEVQAAVLVILVSTFLLGLVNPCRGWVYAIVIGLSIPAAYLACPVLGIVQKYPPPSNILPTFVAMIPAFLGAYSGALAGYIGRAALRKG